MVELIPDPTSDTLFKDRDPKFFALILNYLRRSGKLTKGLVPRENRELTELLEEAEHYNLPGLCPAIQKRMDSWLR